MPFDNQSVDLVGPELLRRMVQGGLGRSGYECVPLDRVDEALKTLGLTDGGQLRAVPSQGLRSVLGVEGLFYGDVEEFSFLNVGFAVRRIVRLRLKFELSSTGELLWEDAGQGLTEYFTLKKERAWRAFMEGLVVREAENLFRTPLMPEAREAVRRLLLSLPPYGMRVNN